MKLTDSTVNVVVQDGWDESSTGNKQLAERKVMANHYETVVENCSFQEEHVNISDGLRKDYQKYLHRCLMINVLHAMEEPQETCDPNVRGPFYNANGMGDMCLSPLKVLSKISQK